MDTICSQQSSAPEAVEAVKGLGPRVQEELRLLPVAPEETKHVPKTVRQTCAAPQGKGKTVRNTVLVTA